MNVFYFWHTLGMLAKRRTFEASFKLEFPRCGLDMLKFSVCSCKAHVHRATMLQLGLRWGLCGRRAHCNSTASPPLAVLHRATTSARHATVVTARASAGHSGSTTSSSSVEVEVEVHMPPEVDPSISSSSNRPQPTGSQQSNGMQIAAAAAAGTTGRKEEKVFRVLLAIISKLWASPAQFDAFIESRPEATSMPFLLWLADQEAQASGEEKERLAALCELLVMERERLDEERMEQLYLSTMDLLTGGKTSPEAVAWVPGGTLARPSLCDSEGEGQLEVGSTGVTSGDAAGRLVQGSEAKQQGATSGVDGSGVTAAAAGQGAIARGSGLEDEAERGQVGSDAAVTSQQGTSGNVSAAPLEAPSVMRTPAPDGASADGGATDTGTASASMQQPSAGDTAEALEAVGATEAAEAVGPEEAAGVALQLQERREAAAALLSSSPAVYAAMLAEKVTGVPAAVDGFDPMYDLLLQAAPPMALTPEGIRKAHEEAEVLAADVRKMRKRSVAALIGRKQLTPEQADRLKAGSPASRILDMLLTVGLHEEREALLPDCFTPPEGSAAAGAAAGEPGQSGLDGDAAAGQQGAPSGDDGTEELWCTPAQLLSEVDVRIRSVVGSSVGPDGVPEQIVGDVGRGRPAAQLAPGPEQLVGPALVQALQQLRAAIMQRFLISMPDAQ